MVRHRGISPCIAECAVCGFLWSGEPVTFSDSRSNFHTRVGYRMSVCRRRLASDLARASDMHPAQGALEGHRDLLSGSPHHRLKSPFTRNIEQCQLSLFYVWNRNRPLLWLGNSVVPRLYVPVQWRRDVDLSKGVVPATFVARRSWHDNRT